MLVKIMLGIALCVIVLIVAVRVGIRIADIQPKSIGVEFGRLKPCPRTPNCISSSSLIDSEQIGAIIYSGTPQQARAHLLNVITSMSGSFVKTQTDVYVHVEFTSRLFGFVDDTEFLFAPDTQQIHLRSASRIGHSDLGANRKRIELIRDYFESIQRTDSQ